MLGRAGLVPKLGPRPPKTTHAVKWVTWYKMRPSDWSIQKMLQSDWLVRIPPPYTTYSYFSTTKNLTLITQQRACICNMYM